jgi:hypothetical protein
LLRHSNKIFSYFWQSCEEKYEPLEADDVKRLIYLLAKWMFVNRWTNDRIFHAPE